MSTDMLKALLAMDSYNRGYDAGIQLDIGSNGESVGYSIGEAIITRESDIAENSDGVNAGFYALA